MLEKVVHTNNGFFVEEFFYKQPFVLKLKKIAQEHFTKEKCEISRERRITIER